jgi:Protein of unknown function (DUF3352)
MSMKKLILPGIGIAAVVGGAAAFLYFNGATGDSANPLAIAKVIPDDAYMAAFISTDEKKWEKLKQFGTPAAQQAVAKSFKDMQQDLLIKNKVDVDKDLKPWMGNIMVAMMPSSDAKKPEPLMAIAIKDKVSALNFANKMKADAKVKSTETDYKGIKVTETASEKGKKPTYTAVLKDTYLVIAGDKKVMEQAIDTFKGEPSFATKPEAAKMLSKTDDVENAVARFYLPDYAGFAKAMLNQTPNAQPSPADLDRLKHVKGIVGAVGIDKVGMRLKGSVMVDPKIAIEYKPAPGKVVAQFPAATFALMSGANINHSWQQISAQAKDDPEVKKFVDMMRGGTQMVGFDLDQDIFGWMDGEFALGMMPVAKGPLAQAGFGGAMVFDTSDRKTAEATLAKLDTLVKTQGGLLVGKRDVNGKKITEWQTPQGALVGHGWLDDDTLFIAMGDPLVADLTGKSGPSLDAADGFKAATGSLPKTNLGYFYLDMEKTMALIGKARLVSQRQSTPPETEAMLDSIKGFGGTSVAVDKTTSQFEVVLALKPATK